MYEKENLINTASPFTMLYKHLPILDHLNSLPKTRATLILPYLDDDTYDVLCNIVGNVFLSNKIFSKQRTMFKNEFQYFNEDLKIISNFDMPIKIRKKLILKISPLIFILLSVGLPVLVRSCRHGIGSKQ